MFSQSRRTFLSKVGRGMLVASLGAAIATDCGLVPAWADEGDDHDLKFGTLEPLVALLQETPADKLLPVLVEKLQGGLDLKTLTAAASLANARTFGGEHYGGFHSFMALAPAYQISQEMPKDWQPLPVLKVLYRNAVFTQSVGGRGHEQLHATVTPAASADEAQLRAAINRGDKAAAEQLLAALAKQSLEAAFNGALAGVEDNHDVHTVVLPWRAWAAVEFTGQEHALTLLRQSVRKCAQQAVPRNDQQAKELERKRKIVPKLLEQYKLLAQPAGKKHADDAFIEKLCNTILQSSDEGAAEAIAGALAEGFAPQELGEAISLASNQLILRQVENAPGNYGRRTHGDSMGVHASDTTNAWRNIIRVCDPRHRAAGLMLAAANVAQSATWGKSAKMLLEDEPYPHAEQVAAVKSNDKNDLLGDLADAIKTNNQLAACAIVERYRDCHHAAGNVFDVLRGYAVSEDGRLHAEKYYRTVTEEFATTRESLRWRQLVALARVTASEYGFDAQDKPSGRAPGYEEAKKLLGVEV